MTHLNFDLTHKKTRQFLQFLTHLQIYFFKFNDKEGNCTCNRSQKTYCTYNNFFVAFQILFKPLYYNFLIFLLMARIPPSKWTTEQDELLMDAVQHCGTQWDLISKFINYARTKHSITKRWHGKLKFTPRGQQIVRDQGGNLEEQRPQNSDETDSSQDLQISTKEKEVFKWTKTWKQSDDQKLKNLIVKNQIIHWKKLARELNTPSRQVRHRWRKIIYPKIKQQSKIGGALKWSPEQDNILRAGVKLNFSWLRISLFLPDRTQYSIEARWRRIHKAPSTFTKIGQAPMNKHHLRRQILRKIFSRRKQLKNTAVEYYQAQSQQKKDILDKIPKYE